MSANREILEKVSLEFERGTFFVPVVGVEIEFYLIGDLPKNPLAIIELALIANKVDFLEVSEEKGKNQFEIGFNCASDLLSLADNIVRAKDALKKAFKKQNIEVNFEPKPFADDCGNALHVHVNLADKNGNNLFIKNGDEETELLLFAVGGMLELLPASMKYIAPTEGCYSRFVPKMNSPTKICWGNDNRTVAIRLPAVSCYPYKRRVEHRVASADADIYLVLAVILKAVKYGIENKIIPTTEKIYGNAWLEQYNLESLPKTLSEAKNISHRYLEDDLL